MQNQLNWTWYASTGDVRAPQTGDGSGRIASTRYADTAFNFDVNFTDGQAHQFALYAMDWDSLGRTEVVQVLDAQPKLCSTRAPFQTSAMEDIAAVTTTGRSSSTGIGSLYRKILY